MFTLRNCSIINFYTKGVAMGRKEKGDDVVPVAEARGTQKRSK